MATSARRFEIGGTDGELRPEQHTERRGGVWCSPASRRAARRQELRLVASVGADESCSNEDGASLSYVWRAGSRKRKAF